MDWLCDDAKGSACGAFRAYAGRLGACGKRLLGSLDWDWW